MSVEIDVLGSMRLRRDGLEQRLGGRRERAVLAVVAAAGGRLVTDERLVDEVWGDDPPATAIGSLQVAVSLLRKVLGDDADLRREPSGYALEGVALDATAFSHAAAALDVPPHDVLRVTGEALGRWRGTPYADLLDAPTLRAEATRLEEDRLRLVEARAQALLDVGRPDDARGLLAGEAEEQPFRERLWSLLALALYRCDRQSEALETLRRLRHHLVEELGVDPSSAVRRLEARLLDHDESLAGPALAGDATRSQTSGVVGRREALAAIDEALVALTEQRRGGVLLLTGEAGIGKSMLAAELGHRAAAHGVQVLEGRCHEADLAPAYWPWLPVVRALTTGRDDLTPELSALLGEARREVSHEGDGVSAATASTLMTSAPLEMDLLGPVTPAGLAAVAAEPTEPMPGIEASRLLDGLDDTAIDALCATAGDPHTTPLMLVQLRGLGGAFADEPFVPSAVRRVTEPFQLFALGVPMVPELAEAIPHGIAAVEGAVAHLTSGHRMPNFVPVGGSDAGGYDAGRLERLRRIKAERDPRGVIRSNKPVAAS